jgi:hypothetical protein
LNAAYPDLRLSHVVVPYSKEIGCIETSFFITILYVRQTPGHAFGGQSKQTIKVAGAFDQHAAMPMLSRGFSQSPRPIWRAWQLEKIIHRACG